MSFTPFSIDAHTKVNLALRILCKRPDGYHDLDTVFQETDWGDVVHFEPHEKFVFNMTGLRFDDGGNNICLHAEKLFREAAGMELPVRVSLEKKVPPGSGIGGGSADGAAVLKGLNQIAGYPLSTERLLELALKLGADVPFFIQGGLQHGQGVGEILEKLELGFKGFILLVIPPIHVSTKQAFEALKIPLTPLRRRLLLAAF